MSGNLTALATQWGTYPASMTTSDKLSALNLLKVAGPATDVSRTAIKTILGPQMIVHLTNYIASAAATQPCLTATNYLLALISNDAVALGDTLKTSDPTILSEIQSLAPNLLADPKNGMTQPRLNRIMALITPPIPWWQVNGFSGPVVVSDLIAAGNLF